MNWILRYSLIFTCLILISCNSDDSDECIENRVAFVNNIDSPSTGRVNEQVIIEVNFRVINGCGQFGKFIESSDGNTTTVEVEATYIGCVCTQNVPIRTINYEFIETNAGTYTIRFKSSDTEFMEAIIEISN